VKLALFGLVFALELMAMMTFIRVRIRTKTQRDVARFPVETYRRITRPSSC